MTYIKTVLVHVDFHEVSASRVKFAAGIASRFGATLLGVSACQMPLIASNMGSQRFAKFEQSEIESQLESLQRTFKTLADPGLSADWRGLVGSPTRVVAEQAFTADIIVVSSHKGSDLSESDVGDLTMMAGRPVIVPALDSDALSAKSVVVAWKNTREARRAVRDSMPFLAMADRVWIASIVGDEHQPDEMESLLTYLDRHGVTSEPLMIRSNQRHLGEVLINEAVNCEADLIVAGAYGHSRFRELAFGGVTHDLLHQTRVSILVSN